MKKILTLCVMCFVAATLVGCGGSSASATRPSSPPTTNPTK